MKGNNKLMSKILSVLFTLLMLINMTSISVFEEDSPFTDVKTTRWSYGSIIYALNNGYMDGVGGGKFSPSGTMTRAMVVTVLYRMEKSPDVTFTKEFSDVEEGKYYSDAVIWAKTYNIVNGVGDGKFNPGGKITREQLAAMLFRFAEYKGYDTRVRGNLAKFPDQSDTHGYAVDSLIWATSNGLITGVASDGSDYLKPRGDATREQFATILERFCETDLTYPVEYNEPVIMSSYTEKEYPLVTDADIYVAPDGNDSAAGDIEHPLATFAGAVEKVRDLKSSGKEGIVVAFRAGTYFTDTVSMGEDLSGTKDNPVVYCAYGDGAVVITGGTIIDADKFTSISDKEKELFTDSVEDSIMKVNMSDILPSFSSGDIIFSSDGILDLARYPNKDNGKDVLMSAGYVSDDYHIRITNKIFQRRIDKYHSADGLQLYGYLTTGWYKDTLDTDGYVINEDESGYDFYIPYPSQARMGYLRHLPEFDSKHYNSIAILNVPEELDRHTEYWYDNDTGNLYIMDPKGQYTIPMIGRGIDMAHCDYVTFRGLTFTSYSEHNVKALECSGITFDRCTITSCSGYNAVYIDGNDGDLDLDLTITDCDFSLFVEKALRVSGFCSRDNRFHHRGNVLFDNNRVSGSHLASDGGCAVEIGYTNEAVISHNEFVDCGRGAVDYGSSCDAIIEYNTFKHCMFNSQDGGVIYSWNIIYDWGNKIRYNVFYPASNWYGIYIDDAEPGTEVYGNLFFKVGTAVCIHNGRSNHIHDNVMISSDVSFSCGDVKETIDEYFDSQDVSVITGYGFYKQWVSLFSKFDSDPELKGEYFSRYPELASLTTDIEKADDPNFVLCPVNYVENNYYFTSQGANHTNDDEGMYSIVEGNSMFSLEENPCFVNPAIGDYRIIEGSEFPDIHFESAGRY